MRSITVGVIDYGAGNILSVKKALQSIGCRVRVTSEPELLDKVDILFLPGVGAFAHAMNALNTQGLTGYIQKKVNSGVPLIGICLGMQLLFDRSFEVTETMGLGLIPGQVTKLTSSDWHIGWNSLEVPTTADGFREMDGVSFYFNHSYVANTSEKYVFAQARCFPTREAFTVMVRRKNVIGFQFHPEKSQNAGRVMLRNVIKELCNA